MTADKRRKKNDTLTLRNEKKGRGGKGCPGEKAVAIQEGENLEACEKNHRTVLPTKAKVAKKGEMKGKKNSRFENPQCLW